MKGGKSPLKKSFQHKNRFTLKSKGYTIVEVMIVLAVSSVMFVIAANFINGRQAKTAFTQGANETASRIQGTIDQVIDGRFSDIKLACSTSSGSLTISTPSVGSSIQQGENADCVFMGKFMHFFGDSEPRRYETFVLAGKRTSNDLLASGEHKVVAAGGGGVNLTVNDLIPQGLELLSMRTGTELIRGLGFVRDSLDGSKVTAVYLPIVDKSSSEATSAIDTSDLRLLRDPAIICITDGVRYSRITVGESGATLKVRTQLGLNKDNCI